MQAVLDRHDIEGGYVSEDEALRVSRLVATLDPAQMARVTGWVREAAAAPGRDLSLGGGWTTVRRVALAEVCALVAQHDVDDGVLERFILDSLDPDGPVNMTSDLIGEMFANFNWREAQHLLAIVRLHLNLDATICDSQPS